ncbi:MAG: hypothetical protein VKI81_02605 [Synechococcaceae cyanobacterium]|nr:hypothetical protein [Synechococcaceae cyanobacterium]
MRSPAARIGTAALLAGLGMVFPGAGARAADRCTFLKPIGGDGTTPIVSKRVGRGKLLGQTNWNTDFIVDRPYAYYLLYFTANSSDPSATYPLEGHQKFSDGSSMRLFSERISPPIGKGKRYGPFRAVPGKRTSQINFKIGASSDPGALGFSYRISVQGCNRR